MTKNIKNMFLVGFIKGRQKHGDEPVSMNLDETYIIKWFKENTYLVGEDINELYESVILF